MTERCLGCHREITWLVSQRRGLHAQQDLGECAECHAEHGGVDHSLLPLPEGGIEQFDHRRTGWDLVDKHAKVECADCHKVSFQHSEAARLSPRKDREGSFLGLEPVCAGCHEDIHRGALDRDCRKCHSPAGWRRPADDFDHAKTSYVLTGRHVEVACRKCHPESGEPPAGDPDGVTPLLLKRPHAECNDCHRDVHQGRAGSRCSQCHVTESFLRTAQVPFDHDRTEYPLAGKHREVRCERCHQRSSGGQDPKLDLATARQGCEGCHLDAHGGQLANLPDRGRCASCHRVEGWKSVTFTPQAHAAAGFPLQGRHAVPECAACHGPERKRPMLSRPIETLGPARFAFDLEQPPCHVCHLDPHDGRFSPGGVKARAQGCAGCHGVEAFRPSTLDSEDHQDFDFPLNGAHRKVACDRCHSEIRPEPEEPGPAPEPPAPASLLFTEDGTCESCHEQKNPHGDQFTQRPDGGACAGCHGETSFKPAERFDHEQGTLFPLLSSHGEVECGECHFPLKKAKKRKRKETPTEEIIVYRGTPIGCRECHPKGVPAQPIGRI